jgi:hypothetical protein
MIRQGKIFLSIIVLGAAMFLLPAAVKASATDGIIDSVNRYAWGDNIGWINFGPDNGGVRVTDNGLTGSAWSPNYGWINLNPVGASGVGIKNDGNGNLSGYAWGENIGWISFSGVKISADGQFIGYATTTNLGAINFNCNQPGIVNSCDYSNFKVQTDWRSLVNRTSSLPAGVNTPPSPSGSGGGSAAVIGQSSNFVILINGGAVRTSNPIVTLEFNGNPGGNMAISNSADFTGISQQAYASPEQWNLCSKTGSLSDSAACASGTYSVFARFYSKWGVPSPIVTSSIIYLVTTTATSSVTNIQPLTSSSSSVSLLNNASSTVVNQVTAAEANNVLTAPASSTLTEMPAAEKKVYLGIISLDKKISKSGKLTIANFIHFGTPTTLKIGSSERAGAISSFQNAFRRLPANTADWQDVIRISNGIWPVQRDISSETRAALNFKLVYSRKANKKSASDNNAIFFMAYGLKTAARNLNAEKSAIKSFQHVYGRSPSTAREWNIVRAIAYSGAKK